MLFLKNLRLVSATVLLSSMWVWSCKKEEPKSKPDASINALIDSTLIPQIPPEKIIRKDSAIESILIEGQTTNCLTYQVEKTQRIESFDYLYSQDQSEIWPGSIVQSKFLRNDGRLVSIGNFSRDPLQYNINGSMGATSFSLGSPALVPFNEEMNRLSKLFWFMPPVYTTQKTQITYSAEQALLDLGINFGFLNTGIKTNFQILNSEEQKTMFLLVKSIYFNVSVDYPTKPSDFFSVDVDVDRLKRVISNDNSPAYISNVSYGRFALVKVKTTSSQQKTKAALDLYFKGLSANLTSEQRNIIETLDLTVEAAPGTSTMLRSIEDVYEFINDGYQFNHRTGYVPVGFEARYLKDNSPLITHTLIEYKVISCL